MNQVVVWDQIVLREKRVVIDERRTRPEYWLLDDGTNLFGNKVRFHFTPFFQTLRSGVILVLLNE